MPNRTEILHFRATPEEKETIRENAGHAELALSEWMRQRSLEKLPVQSWARLTQPAVKKPVVTSPARTFSEQAEQPIPDINHPETLTQFDSETYEQFMERRVPELCGENPSVAEVGDAEIAARAEWAERQ